jgi:hypothetical protein
MGELAALTADLPPIPEPLPPVTGVPRSLVMTLVMIAAALALLGLAAAAHAGPLMSGLGCG